MPEALACSPQLGRGREQGMCTGGGRGLPCWHQPGFSQQPFLQPCVLLRTHPFRDDGCGGGCGGGWG